MANKKAIIAGVGPGNGMAIARRFAAAGYDLALLARSKDKLKNYAKDSGLSDVDVKTVAADFADMKDTDKRIREAVKKLGGVDVLVYNASLYREINWKDLSAEDLMSEVTVGAGSAYAAMRAAGETMIQNGGGTIIATGGGSALRPQETPEAPGLPVTKGAMRNLVLSVASQFAEDNIYLATVTVNGPVKDGTFYSPTAIADQIFETAHLPQDLRVSEVWFRDPKED